MSSKRTFTLADLVPDPITIHIGTETYRGRNADELGVVDSIRMGWMQDELRVLQEQLNDTEAIAAMSEDEQVALAQSAENLTDQMIKMIVPDVSDDQLKISPFARKVGLLQQWTIWQQESQAGKPKTVRAGRVKPR